MDAVNESFSDLVDLIIGFIDLIINNFMHINWSWPTFRDFFPNTDDSKIVLYESIATIIFGKKTKNLEAQSFFLVSKMLMQYVTFKLQK